VSEASSQETRKTASRLAAQLELLSELYEEAKEISSCLESTAHQSDFEALTRDLEQLRKLLSSADSLSRAIGVYRSELRATISLASPRQRVLTLASELVRSLHRVMCVNEEAARRLDPDKYGGGFPTEATREPVRECEATTTEA
jgi:hypothetical protein